MTNKKKIKKESWFSFDKYGHRTTLKGKLIFDERCSHCMKEMDRISETCRILNLATPRLLKNKLKI